MEAFHGLENLPGDFKQTDKMTLAPCEKEQLLRPVKKLILKMYVFYLQCIPFSCFWFTSQFFSNDLSWTFSAVKDKSEYMQVETESCWWSAKAPLDKQMLQPALTAEDTIPVVWCGYADARQDQTLLDVTATSGGHCNRNYRRKSLKMEVESVWYKFL